MSTMMDARQIARQFVARDNLWLRGTALPGFTPIDWWENDVFVITAAGYWVEYEIKVSRSDFFVDAEKATAEWTGEYQTVGLGKYSCQKKVYRKVTKHSMLERGDLKGPSRFFFITPLHLVTPADLPKWAGLIYAYQPDDRGYIGFKEAVKAPRIHKAKCDEKHRQGVYRSCYSRLHSTVGHRHPVCSMESVPYMGPEGAD